MSGMPVTTVTKLGRLIAESQIVDKMKVGLEALRSTKDFKELMIRFE